MKNIRYSRVVSYKRYKKHRVSSDAGNAGKAGKQAFLKITVEKLEKILTFHMPLLEKLEIYFWSISFV